jgi:hypothetical protein
VWAGVDKTSRAGFRLGVGKSPKMPQNPHRPLHALLGGFFVVQDSLVEERHHYQFGNISPQLRQV